MIEHPPFLLLITELNQPVKNGTLHWCFKRAAPEAFEPLQKIY
jgi:hypothetical protein